MVASTKQIYVADFPTGNGRSLLVENGYIIEKGPKQSHKAAKKSKGGAKRGA